MDTMVCFESGHVVRLSLIQMLLPTFAVKYHNELVCPEITAETVFNVNEVFTIDTEWKAVIENVEEPVLVGVKTVVVEQKTSLKKFLAVMPEPLIETELD